jgi:polyferredoxin
MGTRRQTLRRALLLGFFLVLPVTLNYYSPALMTEGTARGIATFPLFAWGAIFLSSLVLGRAFCGYGCPFNGLQAAWEAVSDKPTRPDPRLRWIKHLAWLLWAGSVAGLALAGGGWHRVDLLYKTENIVSLDAPASLWVYFALLAITLLPTLHGKRGFCHHYCPFGVWGIVGTRIGRLLRAPMLHLRSDPAACRACMKCDRACPMSLPVRSMVKEGRPFHTECLLCGSCVDGCPSGGIRYGFGTVGSKNFRGTLDEAK